MSEWIARDGDTEMKSERLDQLLVWARHGKVKRTTLIYHPTLQRWERANALPEFDAVFPKRRNGAGLALAIPLFAFAVLFGMLGMKGLSYIAMGLAILSAAVGVVLYALPPK